MVLSKSEKALEKDKEEKFVYYLKQASKVTGVALPKIKFWDHYCPEKEFNEIAHIHLRGNNTQICISKYMLRALNLDQLEETAIHEFTHLFFSEHDSNFYNKMSEIQTAVGMDELSEKKYNTAAEIIVERERLEKLKTEKNKTQDKEIRLKKVNLKSSNSILSNFVVEINNVRSLTKVTLKKLEDNELRKIASKRTNNEGELKLVLTPGDYKVYIEYNKKEIFIKNISVLDGIDSQVFLVSYIDKNRFDEVPNRSIINDPLEKTAKIGGKTKLMQIQEEEKLEKERLEKQFKELNPPKKWWQFWKK